MTSSPCTHFRNLLLDALSARRRGAQHEPQLISGTYERSEYDESALYIFFGTNKEDHHDFQLVHPKTRTELRIPLEAVEAASVFLIDKVNSLLEQLVPHFPMSEREGHFVIVTGEDAPNRLLKSNQHVLRLEIAVSEVSALALEIHQPVIDVHHLWDPEMIIYDYSCAVPLDRLLGCLERNQHNWVDISWNDPGLKSCEWCGIVDETARK